MKTRYFTITYTTVWPNGKFYVGSVAYESEHFPTFQKCFDEVIRQKNEFPTSILAVTEYNEADWDVFMSELP